MTTTTIRTTCDTCQLTFDVPSAAIVLALPAPTADAAVEPAVHISRAASRATARLSRGGPPPACSTPGVAESGRRKQGARGSPLGCGHAARAGSEVKRVRGEPFTYPAGSRLMVRVVVTGTA